MRQALFLFRVWLSWRRMPMLRFCQLLVCAVDHSHLPNRLFYVDDDVAVKRIRDFAQ